MSPGAPGAVRFRVLGPVEVVVGTGTVPVRAEKQRRLLAVLLAHPNVPLSVDRLIDALWADAPPSSAAQNLRSYVYQLRRLLGDGRRDRVVRDQAGYALRVGPGELDAGRFDALADRGQQALAAGAVDVAAGTLADALALWRGPAFGGLDVVDGVREEAARLAELRLTVLEKRLDADLRLGRHAERVADLVRLVSEHPVRERFRAQLMLALYRSRRQAEALQVYRDGRRGFRDELGLEPGPELRRLERAILTSDPELDLDAPIRPVCPSPPRLPPAAPDEPATPCLLPADVADLTAREVPLRLVLDTLTGEHGTALPVAALTGRGGVGKTSLAVHAGHRLREAFPDGQLYVTLQGVGPTRAEPAAVLARLLRALGVDGSAIPAGTEERAELYRALLSGRRVLVVLDNAADEAQIQPLLPGSASCGVLITSRVRLTGLAARLVELDILAEDQAVELLARTVGTDRVAAEPVPARELVRLCGRLPLALRVVGARLAARSHWSLARMVSRLADERRRLDELTHSHLDVRAGLMLSYEGLPARARRLVALLGLLDAPDIAGWTAAAVAGISVEDAEDLLDELVAARLLDLAGGSPTGAQRYRFHDLVRVFARERAEAELSAELRAATLARTFGTLLGLAEQAHHGLAGVDHLVVHGTAPRHPAPPGVVVGDPLVWCEAERPAIVAAVGQAAAAGLHELCWDLAVTTAPLFEVHSHYDDWRDTHAAALQATRAGGNLRGEAALRAELAELCIEQHRHVEAAEQLAQAVRLFTAVGDRYGAALALLKTVVLDRVTGRHDAALRTADTVLAVLREHGDRGNQALLLRCVGQVHLERRRPDAALPYLERALELARAAGARRLRGQVEYRLGELHLDRLRLEDADAAFGRVLRLVRELGDLVGEAHALSGLARTRLAQGRYDRAAVLLEQVLPLCRQVGDRTIEAGALVALGRLYLDRDQLDVAQATAEAAERIGRELQAPLWEARALEVLGDVRDATGRRRAAEDARRRSRALLVGIGADTAQPLLI